MSKNFENFFLATKFKTSCFSRKSEYSVQYLKPLSLWWWRNLVGWWYLLLNWFVSDGFENRQTDAVVQSYGCGAHTDNCVFV